MISFLKSSTFFLSPLLFAWSSTVSAQKNAACPVYVSASVPAPSVAPGYEARIVASGLTSPRSLTFDSSGNLLVVEQERGITALSFTDHGGACIGVNRKRSVINDVHLNHGITLSPDGKILYASSSESVWSWPYHAQARRVSGRRTELIRNMTTSDHTTRTLLLSKTRPGTLVVTKGSTSNIDLEAEDVHTGHSTVKAFHVANRTHAYDYNRDGTLLGWGLRNDVGVAEEPVHGGIYSVENSADELEREGNDIHQNNPAEEVNFLGYLNTATSPNKKQSPNQGGNFGYPKCFTAWDPAIIPNFDGKVGTQFSLAQNSTENDTSCANDYVAPSLSLQAHMAPLDIKFNTDGSAAWMAFHGSWDRTDPVGYKIGAVQFDKGKPSADPTSKTALSDIVSNQDNSKCPDECFRPAGLAWDCKGRLFFSSDETGEIYVISKRAKGNVNAARIPVSARSSASGTSAAAPSTTTSGCRGRGEYTGLSTALTGLTYGVSAYLLA